MSKQALEDVLRRASTDAAFRARLSTDFDVAVKPYELTEAEKQHLRGGATDWAIRSQDVPARQAASAFAESATAESATAESATAESATAESATAESAMAESAMAESAMAESLTAEQLTASQQSLE